ncbi:MAG: hypothetical protein ACYTDT_11635 [Planctomycetota bacterium]|jgi:hypothetical protein
MNSGNYSNGDNLSADENAVLDHVSGLTSTLPQPIGYGCDDRQIVGELMVQREQLQSLPISAPEMKLTFDDLLARINTDTVAKAGLEDEPCTAFSPAASGKPTYKFTPFFWLSSKWGIGFIAMSSIVLTFVVGWLVNRARDIAPLKRYSQFHAKRLSPFSTPDGGNGVVSQATLAHLTHPDPLNFSQRVTERVTAAGGSVTILTRQDGIIQLKAHVPLKHEKDLSADLLAESDSFKSRSRYSNVLKAEQTAVSDLRSASIEFETLKQLQATPSLATELSLSAENLAVAKLRAESLRTENRYAEWTWQIAKPERPIRAGIHEGVAGLKQTGNWLIRNGITGSPVLFAFVGLLIISRRRIA